MRAFMDEHFLLDNGTAVDIYDHIKNLPIIDYHCHLNPAAITNNARFNGITELWLGGDHYKWRMMRHNGVPESHITGDAPAHEKFAAWCATLETAIGNPGYHWAHLELRNYFGFHGVVTKDNAAEIYAICNSQIESPDFNVHALLKKSRVEWLGTTDDPIDTLEHHKKIKEDNIPGVPKVIPSFRPSNAMDIEKPAFVEYISKLAAASGMAITGWDSLEAALVSRIDHFHNMDCRISDHALDPPVFNSVATKAQAEAALKKALAGDILTDCDIVAYKSVIMVMLGAEYAKRGWVMQLHMGAQRANNSRMLKLAGPDTGFDSMSDATFSLPLGQMLDAMEVKDALPKTVLYALNPTADDMLATMIGNFAGRGIKGRMQWGCPWWFNDNKPGMIKHLITLANHGMVANFIGMLTDSRSFISYPRHEYFRRILANQLGVWAESGDFPRNMDTLYKIAGDIAYYNVKGYFA
ncbi:MAG: glucuronate isomerase [Defluviitaleaceae bacterium]|nr:glucuronate isomerase [Defluviitaleaceae bacterium]